MDAFDRLFAKPRLDGPVSQHYVSESYLKRFARNRRLAVYDRTSGAVLPVSPRHATTEEHLYTVIDTSGRRRFELEGGFAIVESRAGSVLKAAAGRQQLRAKDREDLALFVAMHAVRTPAALAESRSMCEKIKRATLKLTVPDLEEAYRLVKESKIANGPEAELRRLAREMFEMISGDRFRVDIPDEMARAESLKRWSTVAETLVDRDWTIVHAPGAGLEYVTSDSPVVLSPLPETEDQPLGYGSLHARVLFPLSRSAALVMDGGGGRTRHTDARKEQVERFNLDPAVTPSPEALAGASAGR